MVLGILKNKHPLLIYVHAPKAAGSSVNLFLHNKCGRGVSQCQNLLASPKKWYRAVQYNDWISGHIAWNKFNAHIEEVTERSLRYFATVRDPVAQICSHYNWLIEIFHRGEAFYDNHAPNLKEVSEQIRAADNSNPEAVIAILDRHSGLFLNLQSRFILGDDIDLSSSAFDQRYEKYEMICATSELEHLFKHLGPNKRPDVTRENTSTYHVDPEIFKAPQLRGFLNVHNAHDLRLFEKAKT